MRSIALADPILDDCETAPATAPESLAGLRLRLLNRQRFGLSGAAAGAVKECLIEANGCRGTTMRCERGHKVREKIL
jgi:hypothetical protein